MSESNEKLNPPVPSTGLVAVAELERRVKYYERMHGEARKAIKIAGEMSLEMKERLIESRLGLRAAQKTATADVSHGAKGTK